uniref:histidine kinase n=1 Tax=Frankia alni TaxID=1859 RepID=Q05HK2_FRAAL|nr:putative two-component system sensor kinase [Frankia alni ACN14a]
MPAGVGVLVWLDQRLRAMGRPDLVTTTGGAEIPFVLVAATASTVGVALALRRPRHPVGWLFLALGGVLLLSGGTQGYAAYGAVARPGRLPAADLVAIYADAGFIPWLVLVALILHLTPTGRPLSARWGRIALATAVAGGLWLLVGLVTTETMQPPFQSVTNPLLIGGPLGPLLVARRVLGLATGAGVVLAAVSLIVRFRRSVDVERRQLLWVAVAAVPLPVLMAASFAASYAGNNTAAGLAAATLIGLLAIGAGLAIGQYHLYDVEEILSRAVTYLLVSGLLAASYATVVIVVGQSLAGRTGRSQISAVLATLAAVAVTAPAYRKIQEGVDRRFSRRRFETLQVIRRYLRDPDPDVAVEEVLRRALGDPTLAVAYLVDDRRQWVSADGQPANPGNSFMAAVEVYRRGRPIARVTFDRGRAQPGLVRAAATAATAELDNAGLRAAVALQLVEVRQSRTRIAAAQFAERRTIERNLHDGAQQRLLALALQLRAVQLGGDEASLRQAISTGIDQLQAAVVELRELANGLHPAVLADGGLAAALDDVAARTPVPIKISAPDRRYPPDLEAAAWFIACEAMANAVKHAHPTTIAVDVSAPDGQLIVEVRDDGIGGAQPSGPGLRGIADRAEAFGGSLTVHTDPGTGTTIRALLHRRSPLSSGRRSVMIEGCVDVVAVRRFRCRSSRGSGSRRRRSSWRCGGICGSRCRTGMSRSCSRNAASKLIT